MKKLSLLLVSFILVSSVVSAASPIKSILQKYQDDKSCTIITLGSSILNIANSSDDLDEIKDKFDFLRVMAFEGKTNFSADIKAAKLDKYYEELMRIKENQNEIKMYVLEEGKYITEFLMVITGKDDALIQIKGKFTKDDLKSIGDKMDIEQLSHIKQLDELEK